MDLCTPLPPRTPSPPGIPMSVIGLLTVPFYDHFFSLLRRLKIRMGLYHPLWLGGGGEVVDASTVTGIYSKIK